MLQELVKGYNEGYHSGIKRAPSTVSKENEVQVWAEKYLWKKSTKMSKVKFKFSLGDLVQISKARSPFSHGFGQTFTEEISKVRQRFATVLTNYMLEDLNGVQVAGLFYEPEMVFVRGKGKDAEYHVEKIMVQRTQKVQKQVLIKWKRYPNSFNS